MATTFIYALCEPGTRTVRYIGKANNPVRRLQNHLSQSKKAKTRLGNWLRSLNGENPSLVVLREVPLDQWEVAEERYIRLARGCRIDIVNGTDGGDGGYIPASQSPEACAKRRSSMKGRRPSEATLLALQSPEAKAKRSASLKGRQPSKANRIATQTPEAKAKRRASRVGFVTTPEHCANISAGKKGKCTEAMLAAVRDPEICERKRIAMTGAGNHFFGKTHTEETKAKIRAKLLETRLAKRPK